MNTYEVSADKQFPNEFRAECIDTDGSCFVVVFSGPEAQTRAQEYAAWKNSTIALG